MLRNSDYSDPPAEFLTAEDGGTGPGGQVAASPGYDDLLHLALLRAREALVVAQRHVLAQTGLTEQQWRVLRVLHGGEVLDATEIADRTCLMLPSLTRMLGTLEGKALIRRVPDLKDRRKQCISITDSGRAIIAPHLAEAQRLDDRLLAQMGAEKLRGLLEVLQDLQGAAADAAVSAVGDVHTGAQSVSQPA